jgi:predicted ATPase
MIDSLSVKGFKSLLDVSLDMRQLTILVGGNASGKSSALQTLLLLRQSCGADGHVKELQLSGPLFEAGTADDVLHPLAAMQGDDRVVSIMLRESDAQASAAREFKYRFRYARESAESGHRLLDSFGNIAMEIPAALQPEREGLEFGYICAERLGPRVSYPLPSSGSIAGPVGKCGEYTTAHLARARNETRSVAAAIGQKLELAALHLSDGVASARSSGASQKENSDNRLTTITNHALNWIIPGAWYDVAERPNMDAAQLSFHRTDKTNPKPERPTHVGFGLSYALPVIVGALAVSTKGLLICENPECHLHPLSQSRMGVFLAIASSCGPQIVLETHSDHVVNGVRLGIKLGLIDANQVVIHYFRKSEDGAQTEVTRINLDPDGSLQEWPPGFLDQIANDLSRL